MITLDDFLAAFYPGADEPIRLRAFKAKGAPKSHVIKAGITRAQLGEVWAELQSINETRGLYFVVNSGGDCDADITRATSFFAEIDDLPIEEQIERFVGAPLSPSIMNLTRKSVHAYWLPEGSCPIDQWAEIQSRLIAYFGSDRTIKNPSRVMRLPFFDHLHYVKETGVLERKPVELYSFDADLRYTVEEMMAAFPKAETEDKAQQHESEKNTARFWSGFACDDGHAEARRRRYAERAILVACNIISEAPDGSRHEARRRASVLLGGYVGGGFFSESEARAAIESAVRGNTDSFEEAMKTIDSGLRHGQKQPITFEQKEYERAEYLRKRQKQSLQLKPLPRPEHTVILAPPTRPTNTVQLSEVAR